MAETLWLILGSSLPAGKQVFWHKPDATHKARFMVFGIYANMMFSFSDQMDYAKYGKLFKYRKVDAVMADKALAVMNRHGWYLVEELVSFFSNKVDMDMKAHMAARMLTFTPPQTSLIWESRNSQRSSQLQSWWTCWGRTG
jgi:hypothetical protein